MSEVRRVLLANGQYIEIVQGTGSSTGAVMSQSAVTTALNGKANATHTHAASDITSGTFDSARIANGAVTSGKLATNAVTTAKVVDGAITKAKLASDVISSLPASSYETVEVIATASDNKPVNGFLISINGVQYTFNSTGKIYAMVPYGQVYSVTPVSTALFNASGGGTYTASTGNRQVAISYNFIGYGVFIEDKQGKMYSTADWSSGNNANANSVVFFQESHSFRIALTDKSSSMVMNNSVYAHWEEYLSGTTNSGTTDYTAAKTDYNGAINTQLIIEKCQPSKSYPAGACNAYTFPDGVTKGYLPALGELYLYYQNKAAIDAALSACGGETFSSDYYWSSTLYGLYDRYCEVWIYNCERDSVSSHKMDYAHYVRAFGPY